MPQTITISTTHYTARICTLGAELKSVKSDKGTEFMWQADADIWPRTAPVLFPVVGKVKNDQVRVNGVTYPISQHGFARDRNFTVVEQTDSSVKMQLLYDEETLRKYPFDFRLTLTYAWADDELQCGYEVENLGASGMPFSIGAHPGFNIPEGHFEGYYLQFEQPEIAQRHLLEGGLFNHETEPLLNGQDKLTLDTALFDQDAVVFKDLKSTCVALRNQRTDYAVEMRFEGFPYFGIWAKKGTQRFVCLEPWLGYADRTEGHTDLKSKEGTILLPPHQLFTAAYSLTFKE